MIPFALLWEAIKEMFPLIAAYAVLLAMVSLMIIIAVVR